MSFHMKKPEVLLMGRIPDLPKSETARLFESYTVHALHTCEDSNALVERIKDRVTVIATNGILGASAEFMSNLPNLQAIVSFGAGMDNIDLNYARKQGIQVANTPGVLNDDVANMAMALLLGISREIVEADRYVRRGDWATKGKMGLQKGIRNKKVGILGLGGIGRDLAKKLEAFGCEIAYHNRRENLEVPYSYYHNLLDMAKDCEYLIVICPANAETYKMVNREVIDALGPEGALINIARGTIVDEEALVLALQEDRLGAFASDVFANEPHVPDALFEMSNVILIPYLGSATAETRKAMGELMLRNLERFFAKEPLETPVAL